MKLTDPFRQTHRTLAVLLLGVLALLPIHSNAAVQYAYRLTANRYAYNVDWNAAVTAEFGPKATVADWADIKAQFGGSLAEIQSFMGGLGLTSMRASANVLRNGQQFYSSGRSYFLERHDGTIPSGWLVHDHIQSHAVDLGSWYSDRRIIVRIEVPSDHPVIRGEVAGAPAGTKYLAFGTPQVGAFAATISSGKTGVRAIIGADRRLLLKVGDAVPDLPGSVITTLGQPNGDAVLATLKVVPSAGITARNNVVLLRGLSTRTPTIAARTGTAHSGLPVGTTITRFGAIDGNGSAIFFSATVQPAGVKAATALCAALGDGSVKVLARAGDQASGKTIARFGTLVGSAATLAEGRWRVDDETVGLRVSFSGAPATQALYAIPVDAASTADWFEVPTLGPSDVIPGLGSVKMLSFGLPGFGPGASAAIVAKRTNVPGNAAATNKQALLAMAPDGDPTVLIQTGDPIDTDANGLPLSRVKAVAFSDPIVGENQQIAFVVTGSQSSGVAFRGIMLSEGSGAPYLLANVGAVAPGGGHWASLGALVLPDGAASGPVFIGNLRVSHADGITSLTNRGVWGVDSAGELQLLLRSGQPVTVNGATKTLASFSALIAAPGSIGASSGHDNGGNLAVVATCTDRTRALLDLTIP